MMDGNFNLKLFFISCVALLCGSCVVSAQSEVVSTVEGGTEPGVLPTPSESSSPRVLEVELPQMRPGPNITLEQALAAADKRNVTLNAARLEVDKADAQLAQAWALVLPGVQASLQYTHMDHEDTLDFGDSLGALGMTLPDMEPMLVNPQEKLVGSIQAGMPLVNAQSWYTISAAKKGVEVAKFAVEDGRQQLLLGVAQAYFMGVMAHSLIGLREQQVLSAAQHMKFANARYKVGTGLKIDVIRAETDMEQARQELLSAHLALDNVRDAIANLTGMDGLPVPVERRDIEPPQGDEDQLVKKAVAHRDDIKAKKAMIGLMEKQLDASWMQFVPTLDVGWQLQYQFTEMAEMGSTDRSRWALVFTLSVPIYNQFRYGDLDYKRASLRQAVLREEDASRNLAAEVRKARRDYLTKLSSAEIAERQVRLADEALKLVEASFAAGTGTSLDVTDARKTVAAANLNTVITQLEAQVALLVLLRNVGWDMTVLGDR